MPVAAVLGVVSAGASIYSSVSQANAAKKAASAAQQNVTNATAAGGGTPTVDIAALNEQVKTMARQNAIDSLALEKQLTPETQTLRTQSIQGLLGDTAPDQYSTALRQSLFGDFNNISASSPVQRSSLSQAAYDRIAQELASGGGLPQDVRNEVLRRSAATAGRVGGGALDLGHDIGARDLGLTSLDLLNQRIAAAQGAGSAADQFNLASQAQQLQDANNALAQRQSAAGLISNLGTQDFNRRLAIANLGQSISPPQVGLDPGSAASIAIGNQNALQAYLANQQAIATQAANAKSAATGQIIGQIPGAVSSIGGLITNSNYGTSQGWNTGVNNALNNYFGGLDSASTSYVCWVARAVYGEKNPKWLKWREWLLTKARESLRSAYIKNGERFAAWLEKHPENKAEVRGWMDTILESEVA